MSATDTPAGTDKACPPAGAGLRAPSRRLLAAVVAALTLLYLAGTTNVWWPTPDSAMYLGLGRSLAEGQGYQFNGQPHNLVSPGLPLILAALRAVGIEGFWGANLLMCLLGLVSVCFVFLVFKRAAGVAVSAAVAASVAVSYSFYLNAHRILSDMPFMAVFWGTVYIVLCAQRGRRGWLVLVAVLTVIGTTIRVPGMAALVALAVALMFQGRGPQRSWRPLELAGSILGSLAAIAVVMLATAYSVQRDTPPYARIFLLHGTFKGYVSHFRMAMSELPSETCLALVGQEFAPLGVVLLLLGVAGSARLWRQGQRTWGPLWILYALGLAALCGAGATRARYLMPIQPVLTYAILVGLGAIVCRLPARAVRSNPAKAVSVAMLIFVGLLAVSNLPKIVRHAVWYSYLSRTGDYYGAIREGRYDELLEVGRILGQRVPPGRNVAAPDDLSILHFMSRRIVVDLPGPLSVSEADLLRGSVVFDQNLGALVLRKGVDHRVSEALHQVAARPGSPLQPVYQGDDYEAYVVVAGAGGGAQEPGASPPASRPAASSAPAATAAK